MALPIDSFKVAEGTRVQLNDVDTNQNGGLLKENYEKTLNGLKVEMSALQEKLYAEDKRSLLIIFQAMDAAGKDSAIKHVMSGLNPQGCQVYSFKQPTTEELDHDFLWRHYRALPERGRIGIHNRSHYENVLICKVHPKFAANESKLPLSKIDDSFWQEKYRSIRDFEKHLSSNGTTVVKFFLHLSKDEQKKRFLKRITDQSKNWKFAAGDLIEREQWNKYMEAYQDAFFQTSTNESPWYIIPADKKWFARIAICQILVDTLKAINPVYPSLPEEERVSLEESRRRLLEES